MSKLTLVIGPKNYSSWSIRAWLTLKRSGLEFEEVAIRFNSPEVHSEIRRYSPAGKVPILFHGDVRVWVSLAINEYVAEIAPEARLWPSDPAARAMARSASAEMVGGFEHLRASMPMNTRSRRPMKEFSPETMADIERIRNIWISCRQRYGEGGDFLFGGFSIADAMYAPVVSRFITYDVPLGDIERAYKEAVFNDSAVQEWFDLADQEDDRLDEYE